MFFYSVLVLVLQSYLIIISVRDLFEEKSDSIQGIVFVL